MKQDKSDYKKRSYPTSGRAPFNMLKVVNLQKSEFLGGAQVCYYGIKTKVSSYAHLFRVRMIL